MTDTSGYLYKKITQRQEKYYNIFQVSAGLCAFCSQFLWNALSSFILSASKEWGAQECTDSLTSQRKGTRKAQCKKKKILTLLSCFGCTVFNKLIRSIWMKLIIHLTCQQEEKEVLLNLLLNHSRYMPKPHSASG